MLPKSPPTHSRTGTLLIVALCVVVLLSHALTLRPGHTWWGMDDFTAYLCHGRNLLEGRPYGDIDSVTEAELPPSFQRTAFPPAFSLVVGLVDRISRSTPRPEALTSVIGSDPARPYGLDILALKRLMAVFTALAVYLFYRAARPSTEQTVVLLAAAAFGLSPYLFEFRELVRSEALFLCLAYLWMAQVQGLEAREQDGRRSAGLAVLAGVVLALAYATRTAAIVLPPALLVTDLLRHRRVRFSSWILLGVAGACALAQRMVFASVEGGYLGKLAREWDVSTLSRNSTQLAWNYERLWANGFSPGLQRGVAVFLVALAVVGFISRLRRPGLLEVFSVLYGVMIVVLPTDSAWMRYLLPVLPVFLLSVFRGARVLAGSSAVRRTGLTVTAAAAILLSYGGAYAHLEYGPLADGLDDPETVEVFDWVVHHTSPEDTVIFRKSRALTLATGRPSICYPEIYKYGELSDEEQWRHFQAVGAVAFVMKHSPEDPSNMFRMLAHSDRAFVERFVERYPDQLVEVLRNDDFTIYQVRGFPDGG